MAEGFIEQYSDFILDAIPTSRMWSESVATSMLATVIGGTKKTVTRRGQLNLNPWFMYIGTSGIANKTTPLKYFASPMIQTVEEQLSTTLENNKPVSLIFPSRFSIEGLIQYMTKHSSEGIIIRDEFTSAFKDMTKDYMADLAEFLSEMYDGTVQKRYTRSAHLEQTKPAFVTFLAATTPFLYSILKLDFFLQGLGNRILYITDDVESRRAEREEYDNFYQNPTDIIQYRTEKFNEYATDLVLIRKSPIRFVFPNREAGDLILNYKYEIESELISRSKVNVYDVYAPYMSRLPESVYKLTALHTISREYKTISSLNSDIAMSSFEDADWAVRKVRAHFEHFKNMVQLWRTRPEPTIARTVDEQTGTLLDLLVDKEKGLTWSDVRSKIHWTISIWNEVLRQLFDTRRISVIERKQSGPGRPSIVLCQTQHLPTSTSSGEKQLVDWDFVKIKLNLR